MSSSSDNQKESIEEYERTVFPGYQVCLNNILKKQESRDSFKEIICSNISFFDILRLKSQGYYVMRDFLSTKNVIISWYGNDFP